MFIVFVWFYFVFWVVVLLVGWGEIIEDLIINMCKFNWVVKGFKNILYIMGLVGFVFVFLVFLMIVVYVIIYYCLKVSVCFMKNCFYMILLVEDEV